MRRSLSAIVVAAVIAGIFAFLTEPSTGTKNGSHPGQQPAANSRQLNQSGDCSLGQDNDTDSNDCVRSRTPPKRSVPQSLTVIVTYRPDYSSPISKAL